MNRDEIRKLLETANPEQVREALTAATAAMEGSRRQEWFGFILSLPGNFPENRTALLEAFDLLP